MDFRAQLACKLLAVSA